MSSKQSFLTSTGYLQFAFVALSLQLYLTGATDYTALQPTGGAARRLVESPSHVEYRRSLFNPWKGKRTFGPWAGKRDLSELETEDKRAFSPWSGKRAVESEEEKRKFTPWAGKRSEEDDLMSKRKFSPWAGKRSDDTPQEDKRKFSPWAGKRSSDLDTEKRKFEPWAGKRSILGLEAEKRKFGPWSGKRSVLDEDSDEEKRTFSPWAGKRAFQAWAGKRAFNSWAGKRNVDEMDSDVFDGLSEDDEVKRTFNPWSGKRNSWDLTDEDMQEVLHHITKRSAQNIHDHHQQKRTPQGSTHNNAGYRPSGHFNALDSLGSRASASVTDNLPDQHDLHHLSKRSTGNQKKFNPWAGKRSLLWSPGSADDDEFWNSDSSLSSQEMFDSGATQKRAAAAFPPWASSRLFSQNLDNYDKSIFSTERRGFSPWAGKRVVFQPWAG